jgi:hypothetical protein
MALTINLPKIIAWRNIREPKMIRSEPPHQSAIHLWEPLCSLKDAVRFAEKQQNKNWL